MDIKEAIKIAKNKFLESFSERMVDDRLLLEEIESYENDGWKITLSFFEKRQLSPNMNMLAILEPELRKVYKVVYIQKNGVVEKIKNYD